MNKAAMFKKTETVKIEITPGYFIDVNSKYINKSKTRIRTNRAKSVTVDKHRVFSDAFRAQNKGIKYSSLILDEAVSLSIKKGMKYAVKKTGVKHWSIVQRKRRLAMAGLYKTRGIGGNGSRYTIAQKQKCVSLAKQLMADPGTKTVKSGKNMKRTLPKWSQRPAFIEAGKRLGMNGRSIEHMYVEGMINESSTHRPA